MTTCNIDGCDKPHEARGWCNRHYNRWRKFGDPLGTAYRTVEEKFLAMTEPIVGDPGCIIWTGAVGSHGYGTILVGGKNILAHRYSWEQENGPIPEGVLIDHTCHQRLCVRPDHLRLANYVQNGQNRRGADRGRDLPRGVYRRESGRYAAGLQFEGRRISLGMFDTPEAASIAAQNKRALLYGDFAGRA